MERRTTRMYVSDLVVIWVSLVLMWGVLAFVLVGAIPLAGDSATRAMLTGSAALAGIFASSALLAVLGHLRRNRDTLYREDVSHLSDR